MSGRDGISRREFLGHGVVTLGALWSGLPGLARKALAAIPPPLCPTIGFFAPHVYDTLAQVTGQIVPTDADPGGIHTCLATFLEMVASGDPGVASLMNTGVAALDQSSQILFGSNYSSALRVCVPFASIHEDPKNRHPSDSTTLTNRMSLQHGYSWHVKPLLEHLKRAVDRQPRAPLCL